MLNWFFCSSLCRQIVVDDNGDAKWFQFDNAYASLTLRGQIDIDLAIVSRSFLHDVALKTCLAHVWQTFYLTYFK